MSLHRNTWLTNLNVVKNANINIAWIPETQNKVKTCAKMKFAAFFAEHNIAFSVADLLTALLKQIIIE